MNKSDFITECWNDTPSKIFNSNKEFKKGQKYECKITCHNPIVYEVYYMLDNKIHTEFLRDIYFHEHFYSFEKIRKLKLEKINNEYQYC